MRLTNEFESIRNWARAKGIIDKGDPKTQTLKLTEEVGELSKAILEGNSDDVSDAIGDCVVVLTSIAELWKRDNPGSLLKIESAINGAYAEIAGRSGNMQNGTFVKEVGHGE
jgi:NTP pyrophosphatase (non-canonical NTP hydrolase)